jgi:hypothetical protein
VIGLYLPHFFKFGIADEVHEAKAADTAQGNALGTLAAAVDKTIVLTGTLTGGMASDVFNILYRIDPKRMVSQGYEYGESGIRSFTETYGVLETITTIEPQENVCLKAKVTRRVKERPGASPLLFARFLIDIGAFVSLEDISANLPPYSEEVVNVPMDKRLAEAYAKLEEDITAALQEHRGNSSVISTALNALLLYPDRPFSIGPLWGIAYDEETKRRERFPIADPPDLDESMVYAKERKLIELVQAEMQNRRGVQIFATYTQKRDVTRRIESVLSKAGIQAAVLTTQVPPEDREAWYDRQLKAGVQVFIGHPRLVQTGLDLIFCPAIIWYQTGYSTFTLRQASRRSWRIGQTKPVTVRFLCYENTAQVGCLRLMGRKLLVSMALEGKFSENGLQAMDEVQEYAVFTVDELAELIRTTPRQIRHWKEKGWLETKNRKITDECLARFLREYPNRIPFERLAKKDQLYLLSLGYPCREQRIFRQNVREILDSIGKQRKPRRRPKGATLPGTVLRSLAKGFALEILSNFGSPEVRMGLA